MNKNLDYRLANRQKKEIKLRVRRREILKSDSEKALDMLLGADAPATLIQSFPEQDLYYLMHKIGACDFIPVLSLATSEQWEYLLDVEVWNNDRLNVEMMTTVFDLLFQADSQRLLRWTIKEKPDFFEFYLYHHLEIRIREHDDPPPSDYNDYITIDDKFYFRFPDKPGLEPDEMAAPSNSQAPWELIEKMLKRIADMDLSVYHGLLLETCGLLPSEIEEEHFRLKNNRLSEKGFLPAHEAIGIYQPVALSQIRKRPEILKGKILTFDPDIPMPPQFFSQFIKGDDLFVKSLEYLDPDFLFQLESETAALINKVISADKIKLRSKDDLEKAVFKTAAYINLGLEVILDSDLKPEDASIVISQYFLEDIFKTGSRTGIKLKAAATEWYAKSYMNKASLPLSFLDETYMGVIGGLFLERPLYFDKYSPKDVYRDFKNLFEITHTDGQLQQIIALDMLLGKIDVDISTFKEGVLTYKTYLLTLWAKNRLNLPHNLEPIGIEPFKIFFTEFFTPAKNTTAYQIQLDDLLIFISELTGFDEGKMTQPMKKVMSELIEELASEYESVGPNDIDPRFIPHFLI